MPMESGLSNAYSITYLYLMWISIFVFVLKKKKRNEEDNVHYKMDFSIQVELPS